MKVLHVETGRYLYGGAKQVLHLIKGLSAEGVNNILCAPSGSDIASAAEPYATVATTTSAGDLDFKFFKELRNIIRQHRPDIIHLHSRRGADVLGGIAGRLSGIPTLLSRRVDNPESRIWAKIKYSLYTHVITISDGIRNVLLNEGVAENHISCVRSAIEPEHYQHPKSREAFLQTFKLNKQHVVLAVIAQFIPRKGHRHLIEILPALEKSHENLQVLFFGKGPEEENLKNLCFESGVDHLVQFAGFRNDLEDWLAHIDLVVHPAEREGLGVSLIQAAAASVPMIASAAGGMPEIVRHEHNGLLIPPGNTAALSQAIETLLSNPNLRKTLGENGRKLAEQEFSVASMVAGNLRIYHQFMQQTKP